MLERGIGCPPRTSGRIPEPRGVQVGEVSLESGSSDARRSHQPDDVPSPSSMSIGSRKYKTLANSTDKPFYEAKASPFQASAMEMGPTRGGAQRVHESWQKAPARRQPAPM